ncbi:MAG: hypothetical protein K2X25_04875 [Caulobacteraceae bacterium]|nr:hypothetical protein [Caulobacteraceae bacterium]
MTLFGIKGARMDLPKALVTGAFMMVAMTGCDRLPGTAEHRERLFIEAVKAEMDTVLFDYPSARFQNVRITSGGNVVCGQVNSKNRLGAYVGWRSFEATDLPIDPGKPINIRIGEGPEDEGYCAIRASVDRDSMRPVDSF